jgi:ribosomal subunit interface protein
MRLQIVARHCDIPTSIRSRTEQLIEKLSRFEPRLQQAEVIFEEERHLKRVEGIVTVDGGEPAVARGEGADFKAAVDEMNERLRRMLRRRKEKARNHHGPTISEVAAPEA